MGRGFDTNTRGNQKRNNILQNLILPNPRSFRYYFTKQILLIFNPKALTEASLLLSLSSPHYPFALHHTLLANSKPSEHISSQLVKPESSS